LISHHAFNGISYDKSGTFLIGAESKTILVESLNGFNFGSVKYGRKPK
jgi:hypothetical protein